MVLLQLDKKARADQETETKIVEEIEDLWKKKSEIIIYDIHRLIKKLDSVIRGLKSEDNNNKEEIIKSVHDIEK